MLLLRGKLLFKKASSCFIRKTSVDGSMRKRRRRLRASGLFVAKQFNLPNPAMARAMLALPFWVGMWLSRTANKPMVRRRLALGISKPLSFEASAVGGMCWYMRDTNSGVRERDCSDHRAWVDVPIWHMGTAIAAPVWWNDSGRFGN
jgi:hypothetical protein